MQRNSIIAISGEFCSGKETITKFFEENYKFKVINLDVCYSFKFQIFNYIRMSMIY